MDSYETRVLKTEESSIFQQSGGVARVYRVTFMVGESGPFTADFKALDFEPTRVKEAIERVAATVRAIG